MGGIRPLKQGSQGSHETPSEKKVQDITINAFYEPHTLTFLAMIAVSTVLQGCKINPEIIRPFSLISDRL